MRGERAGDLWCTDPWREGGFGPDLPPEAWVASALNRACKGKLLPVFQGVVL